MNDIRVGLEIQAINNGYLVTGIKTNGYQSANSGKTFFKDFDEMASALVDQVRQSLDLEFEPSSGFNPFGMEEVEAVEYIN